MSMYISSQIIKVLVRTITDQVNKKKLTVHSNFQIMLFLLSNSEPFKKRQAFNKSKINTVSQIFEVRIVFEKMYGLSHIERV